MTGNALVQTIQGDAGNNRIDGGTGKDSPRGNLGSETFSFTKALGVTNIGRIVVFTVAADQIELDQTNSTTIPQAASLMFSSYFNANATGTATDPNEHITCDIKSGAWSLDCKANVAGDTTQFARRVAGSALSLNGFDIEVQLVYYVR